MTEDEQKYEARIEEYVMLALSNAYDRALAAAADDAAAAVMSGSGGMYAAYLDIMREVADRMLAASETAVKAMRVAFGAGESS